LETFLHDSGVIYLVLVRKNFNSKLDLIFNFRVGMRLKEEKKKKNLNPIPFEKQNFNDYNRKLGTW